MAGCSEHAGALHDNGHFRYRLAAIFVTHIFITQCVVRSALGIRAGYIGGGIFGCRGYGFLLRQIDCEIVDPGSKCGDSRYADKEEHETGKRGAFWF